MTDREFLMFIHERLEHVHKENALYDYMHRLRHIIYALPRNQRSNEDIAMNDFSDLEKKLEEKDKNS